MGSVLELLLADARTPSGSFAHSGGLEAALGAGLSAPAIPGFIRARLMTIGACDAALAVGGACADSIERLLALDEEAAARTPAAPLRDASRRLGRALLRTVRTWWPQDPGLAAYAQASTLTPRSVVLGIAGRAAALPLIAVARLSLYDDAATVIAAAVKLVALDPAAATGWLATLEPAIEELARSAALAGGIPDLARLPSSSTPLLDLRALAHTTSDRRLFVS
jgi:urease accessory protein